MLRLTFALVLGLAASGCATAVTEPSSPAERRSTPTSVSQDDPGGDAEHPTDAALERLLTAGLGSHVDYWHTLDVPLPDKRLWRGTKFKRYPTRAAYYYGRDRIALSVISFGKAEGEDTPSACLKPLLTQARVAAKKYKIALGPMVREVRTHARGPERVDWTQVSASASDGSKMSRGGASKGSKAAREARVAELKASQPHAGAALPADLPPGKLVVVRTSAKIDMPFRQRHYVAALAAYESWPGTCLVQTFAVQVGSDVALAERVVTRWIDDAAPKLSWASWLREAPPFENR